ncbi:MAG TPA: hypothetical protein PLV91_00265 [Verrucomicrobiota bacterium]|jgi:hypothetical protein|nr:hypothetical protein [Verrucomicrobiota bacterium]
MFLVEILTKRMISKVTTQVMIIEFESEKPKKLKIGTAAEGRWWPSVEAHTRPVANAKMATNTNITYRYITHTGGHLSHIVLHPPNRMEILRNFETMSRVFLLLGLVWCIRLAVLKFNPIHSPPLRYAVSLAANFVRLQYQYKTVIITRERC